MPLLPPEPPQPLCVLKFGGTSVSSAERWATLHDIVRHRRDRGEHPVVVCSATAGTSDALSAALDAFEDPGAAERTFSRLLAGHEALAASLEVDAAPATSVIEEARGRLDAACALGELTPRTRAQVMSAGEWASTLLGAAYLRRRGLDAVWTDARALLDAEPTAPHDPARWLSATCDHRPDARLAACLPGAVSVTQGFLARDPESGELALLGRGGSDTSAAYLAARLGAVRLEIWTDVPGLFSAHPGIVPTAVRLEEVSYAEAACLASMGARVLHPRCIAPVRDAGIPLEVRCTVHPELPGTTVHRTGGSGVRAVTHRTGLHLLRMHRPPRWQQVGFLADVTGIFRDHGLSIDLLVTSQGRILATIDPASAPLAEHRLGALLRDLEQVCEPEHVQGVGSVSLVGTGLSRSLAELGEALEAFGAHPIGGVVTSADDTHVTFVLRGDDVEEAVRALHHRLFDTSIPRLRPPPRAEAPGAQP